jgi:hypothetical protein
MHKLRRSTDFYPEGCFITDIKGDVYRLMHRQRRKLNIPVPRGISPVLVAKPDLLGVPAGEPLVSGGEVQGWPFARSHVHAQPVERNRDALEEGMIIAATNERDVWYQISGNKRRRFVTPYAAERWGVQSGHVVHVSANQLRSIEEGWPIIAPPQLLNEDL